MIDKLKIISQLRTALLDAEIVELIAVPGYFVAIRDGEYDPLKHIRPADPAKTPILDSTDIAFIEQDFDKTGAAFQVDETFIPTLEQPSGVGGTSVFVGIMQYSVMVPYVDGNEMDIQLLYNKARYIAEVFDPKKDDLTVSQPLVGLVLDSASIAPYIKERKWVTVPVSVNFRAYEYPN